MPPEPDQHRTKRSAARSLRRARSTPQSHRIPNRTSTDRPRWETPRCAARASRPVESRRRSESLIGAKYQPDLVVLSVDMTDPHDDLKGRNLLRWRCTCNWYDRVPIALKLLRLYFLETVPGSVRRLDRLEAAASQVLPHQTNLGAVSAHLTPIQESIQDIAGYTKQLGAGFVMIRYPRSINAMRASVLTITRCVLCASDTRHLGRTRSRACTSSKSRTNQRPSRSSHDSTTSGQPRVPRSATRTIHTGIERAPCRGKVDCKTIVAAHRGAHRTAVNGGGLNHSQLSPVVISAPMQLSTTATNRTPVSLFLSFKSLHLE
ncbi:MAG: hypothetical protein ACI841_000414 [Planctomycetota bacterium]|jgi:hypothetical protein